MGRGPTAPGSLGPPAGLVSPAEPQPASLAALILPRARRTMVRHTRCQRRKWAEWEQQQQQEHNQRQPQPPQPQPPRGRRNRGWTRWHNRLNLNDGGDGDGGSTNRYDQAVMRFRKKFFRKLFRRWAAKARAAPQLRLFGPRQWRVAFWILGDAPWRAFQKSLCRVVLLRWAAAARAAVRTRTWKACRWEAARTRIASRQWTRSAAGAFWAWFTAARAGTLVRRGTLFWERAEVGAGTAGMRSASWPP